MKLLGLQKMIDQFGVAGQQGLRTPAVTRPSHFLVAMVSRGDYPLVAFHVWTDSSASL